MCALDQEHAKLISASEDELEVEALSRVTVDTRWKINLFRWAPSKISKIKWNRKSIICSAKPNSLPATIKLIDECKSEDLGSIFTRWTQSSPHQNILATSWQVWETVAVDSSCIGAIHGGRFHILQTVGSKFGQQPFLVIKHYLVEETMLAIILSKWS